VPSFMHIAEGNIRDAMTVSTDDGLVHGSVLCDRQEHEPFVVTLCDFFVEVDNAVARVTTDMDYPTRRWPLDHEKPGVITCLACIGG
jgi:hypothetical protein